MSLSEGHGTARDDAKTKGLRAEQERHASVFDMSVCPCPWEEQRSVTSAERPSQPSGERRSGCVARPTVRDMVLADWREHLLIEAVFAGIGAEISVGSSRPERSWLHARALSLLVPDRISDDLNFRESQAP